MATFLNLSLPILTLLLVIIGMMHILNTLGAVVAALIVVFYLFSWFYNITNGHVSLYEVQEHDEE